MLLGCVPFLAHGLTRAVDRTRPPRQSAFRRQKLPKVPNLLKLRSADAMAAGAGALDASVALSAFFMPIALVGQLVALIFALAKYPSGTPDRAALVHDHILRCAGAPLRGGAWAAERLIARVGADVACARLVAAVYDRDDKTAHLVPAVTECVACGHPLETMPRPSHKRVFAAQGELAATVHTKHCTACGATHTMSYAYGGLHLPVPVQRYYARCTERAARWFQSKRDTIFDIELLERFEAQALHSHTGFDTFAREYETYTGNSMGSYGGHSLAQEFLAWSLLRWRAELGAPLTDTALGRPADLDATLQLHMDELSDGFVAKWGRGHVQRCRRPGSCDCHIIDGHMKCRRIVCANSAARRIEMGGGLGAAVLGCLKTPVRGSRFCSDCGAATARCAGPECVPDMAEAAQRKEAEDSADAIQRVIISNHEERVAELAREKVEMNAPPGVAALGDGPLLYLDAAAARSSSDGMVCQSCDPIDASAAPPLAVPAAEAQGAASNVAQPLRRSARARRPTQRLVEEEGAAPDDAAPDDAAPDDAEHLVETLLQAGRHSRSACPPDHRECAAAGMRVFLVKWAPSGGRKWRNSWECACNISDALIDDYDKAHEAGRAERENAKRARDEGARERQQQSLAEADAAEAREQRASRAARQERREERRKCAEHAGAVAAKLPPATGDCNISPAEREELDALCNTWKDTHTKSAGAKKHQTAGAVFMVSACGLFMGIRELYGSESLTQAR